MVEHNMTFNIITLFPKVFEPYFEESIIGRAKNKGLIKIKVHNLRDFTKDKHHKVDDRPFGGGPGMLLKAEPLVRAIQSVKSGIKSSKSKTKIILFSASGKQFDDKTALKMADNYDQFILISGHYEGVDERIKKIFKIEEISVGPYVLTGGELPAMLFVDALSRKIKGVLGKEESLEENRLGVGIPAYTRPDVFTYKHKKYPVPKVLLSGNHAEIMKWRLEHKRK